MAHHVKECFGLLQQIEINILAANGRTEFVFARILETQQQTIYRNERTVIKWQR